MKKFRVTVNGNTYEVDVEEIGTGASSVVSAPSAPVQQIAQAAPKAPSAPASAGGVKVIAPMPGKIIDVKVSQGQQVNKGDVVAILEAMKMENEVVASESGTVASINVNKGQAIESGDIIVTLN
ncbi:biotin-dependent enzyme [Natranaerovirga pectinivora]|uniref:Biotin-dependent enzyme n=1 Tax=Natranaerovirga pectinivora TaxID=682400 RepID=A0A4R3MR08_9FIRM|nr:biotin/lipoyl-containing protein [Natranaerovirga pectinivora]TCT15008.1 biotin-dependent enzyme [Natranaerovirga pectinivora]